jgi:preprotein translocase subunit SecF
MQIISRRRIWYVFSALLVGGSLLAFAVFGLRQGIDFTGGTLLGVRFAKGRPPIEQLQSTLAGAKLDGFTVQPVGDADANIRTKTLTEAEHQSVVAAIEAAHGDVDELQYNAVGPAVGNELRQKALTGLVVAFLAILAFIAWSFRSVSRPVQSWKYGLIVLATALHDIAVPLGLFAILGRFWHVEVGAPFIAAILTVMGYSINDTIVVMDRIRENLQKSSGSFEEIVERSLSETIIRSVNTSFTTVLSLLAVLLFGGRTIHDFALALIVGILTGTYSSIFIASPLLVSWYRWSQKKTR